MSSDEAFVEEVLAALTESGIEAIVVGSVAALLQGARVTTESMDVLVRDTPRNREKLVALERALGHKAVQVSPLTPTLRIPTPRAHVDVLFDEISGKLRFESLRSRSVRIRIGALEAVVAALEDVIASKEAAGRPKLRVRRALDGDRSDA